MGPEDAADASHLRLCHGLEATGAAVLATDLGAWCRHRRDGPHNHIEGGAQGPQGEAGGAEAPPGCRDHRGHRADPQGSTIPHHLVCPSHRAGPTSPGEGWGPPDPTPWRLPHAGTDTPPGAHRRLRLTGDKARPAPGPGQTGETRRHCAPTPVSAPTCSSPFPGRLPAAARSSRAPGAACPRADSGPPADAPCSSRPRPGACSAGPCQSRRPAGTGTPRRGLRAETNPGVST